MTFTNAQNSLAWGTRYQVGGSLPFNAPSYVCRQADQTLFDAVMRGEFCYVLTARQMGKSSLRVHTMQRLQAEGVICTAIDVTKIGSQNLTADQWYASLVGSIMMGLNLGSQVDLRNWWRDRSNLTPVQRLSEFVETVLITGLEQPIAIFIDEIDSLLSLNFSMDDFFAWIRFIYNHRADNPALKRLSMVLLGVTTPADLIQDKTRTPFNIGCSITLQGFQAHEVAPLSQGLQAKTAQPEALVKAILAWTNGQPFLTQKLCAWVDQQSQPIPPGTEQTWIDALVQDRIVTNWDAHDEPEHLKTIRNRLLRHEQQAGRLLGLYQQILHQGRIAADDSPEQMELRLTGLVELRGGYLHIQNRIYPAVFDNNWIEQQLASLRPYSLALQAWVRSDGLDTSTLLRGQALESATRWATGKSLSNQDYQFLKASQEQANHDVQLTLIAERKAKEAAEQANEILTNAQQKARRITRNALVGLGFVSVITVVAIATLVQTNRTLQTTQASLTLEQLGVQTLQQFSVNQIAALLSSLDAARQLQTLVKPHQPLQTYPTTKPIFVLQQILDQIQARNTWQTQQGRLLGGQWSVDGNSILTAGSDGSIRRWAIAGRPQTTLINNTNGINRFLISAASQRLITAGEDGQIKFWTLAGKPLQTLNPNQGSFRSVRLDPQEQRLGTAGQGDTVKIWSMATGELLQTLATGQGQILSLAFGPNGETIATAGWDGTLKLWSKSGALLRAWPVNPLNPLPANSIVFHPNGQQLLTASEAGFVQVWSLAGQPLNQWRGSQAPIYNISLSPDGQTILTVSEDRAVRLWDPRGRLLSTLPGAESLVSSASFHPRRPLILTTSLDGTLALWNLHSSKTAFSASQRQQFWITQHRSTWGLALRPGSDPTGDGAKPATRSDLAPTLATSGEDGQIRIWTPLGLPLVTLPTQGSSINTLSYSPDGQFLLASSQNGTITLWQVLSRLKYRKQFSRQTEQGSGNSLSWHPQNQGWITAGDDGRIKVWNQAGQVLQTLAASNQPVWAISYSPKGDQIAAAGRDGQVQLWSPQGQKLRAWPAGSGWVGSLSYHPQGQLLATGGKDGWIRIWDQKGKEVQHFRSHLSGILNVVFSHDGELLAVAGQDGWIRVWTTSGQAIAQFEGHQGAVYGLRWSADGKMLFSVGEDDTLRTWQTDNLTHLIHQGCEWLANYLMLHPEQNSACKVSGSKDF